VLPDHYATLGVAPNCGRAAIRAAYLELMRRYHPDRNPSAAAAAHVHAITAAYAILGVPERRELYDRDRARLRAAQAAAFVPDRPRARLSPWIAAPFVIVAVALLVPTLLPPPLAPPVRSGAPPSVGGGKQAAAQDRLRAADLREQAVAPEGSALASLCESPSAARRVKRELFRRAAQLGGSEQSAFARLAEHSLVRIGSAAVSDSDRRGDVSCSASVSLDLPPGVAARGGRRTLTGQVSYSMQAGGAASGSFNLISEGRIVQQLATLRPDRTVPGETLDGASVRPAPAERAQLPPKRTAAVQRAPRQPPRVAPERSAVQQNPSFSCELAKSWAAIWVCNSAKLAALDREMASLYGSAMGRADGPRRDMLLSSQDRFLARRNGCTNQSCVESAYSSRLGEIRNIMAGTPPPR
jgi:curved DNA-binding protein CbpA/uncharacterized protein YecT (DUF1311 family)